MKIFSADQQEMKDHEQRKYGKGSEKPITLTRTAVSPKGSKRLIQGWEEYVYAERIRSGMYGKLADLAMGGKGKMTYPHWPPTSRNEALALLDNCLKEDNIHRK